MEQPLSLIKPELAILLEILLWSDGHGLLSLLLILC